MSFACHYGKCEHPNSNPTAPILEVKNVTVGYTNNCEPVLKNLSLELYPGDNAILIGKNGCGKSTFFKTLTNEIPLQTGEVLIHGSPRGNCHHLLAYLPQRSTINWYFPMDLFQFVLSGRYVHLGWFKRPQKKDKDIAEIFLKKMGLWEQKDKLTSELSGGQQQRALLARALTQQAEILLLDEPLNAIDQQTKDIIGRVFEEGLKAPTAVIMATHEIPQWKDVFNCTLNLVNQKLQKFDNINEAQHILSHGGGCHHG
ncbi:MAG: ATP-binding cassette domain-containing protein [Lentisphaeria bacterium]|nr:ATP-binding cassette domain-containing protein [Lentisphaeria bacterium]